MPSSRTIVPTPAAPRTWRTITATPIASARARRTRDIILPTLPFISASLVLPGNRMLSSAFT